MKKTYWNGEPCEAKRVIVIVGKSLRPTWWCAEFEGKERDAVKITAQGESFYVDDEPSVWQKMYSGGGPFSGSHKSLPVEREL